MLLSINITFACITIVEFLSTDPIFDIDILVFMNESFTVLVAGTFIMIRYRTDHENSLHFSRDVCRIR